MKRSALGYLFFYGALGVSELAVGQDVEGLVGEMCAPTLTGSDIAKDNERLARAEQAAEKVLALKGAAVPALLDRLGTTSPPTYAREALVAIGHDCFPAFRAELAKREASMTRNHLLPTIANMGIVAEPLVPDLLELANDPETERPDSIFKTLIQISSDRQTMVGHYARYIEANPKSAKLGPVVDLCRIMNARELAALFPACKKMVDAQGDYRAFSYSLLPLSYAGPDAAPLVPEVIAYWEQLDSPRGSDALNAVKFLACVGPHPDSKRKLPDLEAWLAEEKKHRYADAKLTAWLGTAIACIQGRPAAAPEYLECAETFLSAPKDSKAWSNFSKVLDTARPVVYHDPRAASRLNPPLAKALELYRDKSGFAEIWLRYMGPLSPATIPSVAAAAVYDPEAKELTTCFFRGRCAALLGDHAHSNPAALAALKKIAEDDRNLMVRNKAMAAIRYAEKVGPRNPTQPVPAIEEPPIPTKAPLTSHRTWKSSEGNFSVEARLVSADATTATLEAKDPKKVIQVPLEKLSPADRRYIEALPKR